MVIATERRRCSPCSIPRTNPSSTDARIRRAGGRHRRCRRRGRSAAEDWASRAPRERAEILRRAFELMTERNDEIARLDRARDGQAARRGARRGRLRRRVPALVLRGGRARGGDYAVAPAGTNRMLVAHAPIGISLLITPWNFPAAMATRKIGPALAAGCTVVLKPAEETPLTALAIARLLDEAGVPRGRRQRRLHATTRRRVAEADPGRPARAQALLHRLDRGRAPAARAVRAAASSARRWSSAATRRSSCSQDADLDVAVAGAMAAKMRNGGEACTAANRFLVHESVAEDFTRAPDRGDGRRARRPRASTTARSSAR